MERFWILKSRDSANFLRFEELRKGNLEMRYQNLVRSVIKIAFMKIMTSTELNKLSIR